MIFRIHFEVETSIGIQEDSIIVIGKDEDEVRKIADKEVAKLSGKNPWSEEII